MNQIAQQQQIANVQLNQSLQQQRKKSNGSCNGQSS